ncbi:hypothetical protein JTE90_022777 [Oedothorax gibbosus]|uniref:La-related protein 6 n=1 Tax=Oedothorax gibbosus TaxID=931172 RepID=A0AAV6U9Y8_9ARAC|nr:hypothetical protein JTE90_022777 [Oedothorax gibbosus]
MEVGRDKMGQVGYVSRKMSNMEIFKENKKIAVDDKVPKNFEKSKSCDGTPKSPKDFSENFAKEDIYLADFMNGAEDENIAPEDHIRKSDTRNDQLESTEVKNLTGEIERYIGAILRSSENIDKQEINKMSEVEKEEKFISTLSNTRNEKHEKLSTAASEKKVFVASLFKDGASKYSATENDIANNSTEKSMLSDNKENKMNSEHAANITTDEDHLRLKVKNLNNLKANGTKANNNMVTNTSPFIAEKSTDENCISSTDVNDFEDIITKKQDEALIKDVILDFLLTGEHSKCVDVLSGSKKTEDTTSLVSNELSLISPEHNKEQGLEMFSASTEEKDEIEILTKEVLSQVSIEKEKKEHFIYDTQNYATSSTLETNEEYKNLLDGFNEKFEVDSNCEHKNKKDLDTSSKIMPLKYEAGKGIEDQLSSKRADTQVINESETLSDFKQDMIEVVNDLDLSSTSEYECVEFLYFPVSPTPKESVSQSLEEGKSKMDAKNEDGRGIKDQPSLIRANTDVIKVMSEEFEYDKDISQVVNDFEISSSLSEYECIDCLDSPTSRESLSQSSEERKTKEDLGFTSPQTENTLNLAMLSTPSSNDKVGNEISSDIWTCECCDKANIVDSPPIKLLDDKEQLLSTSNKSSPACNEHIGILTDYICSECRSHEEQFENLTSVQVKDEKKCAEYFDLLRSDNEEKIVKNLKSYERENKVLPTRNVKLENSENKQDAGKKVTSENTNNRKVILNASKANKYGPDTKGRNQKGSSFRKPEFKFSRTNSSTSHTSNEVAFEIPSDALAEKIVKEAEIYFSDFNIMKNNFILKHIRRNKEGYLSVKLVASCRKIKSLTRDWRVVAYSLEGSKLLQLNAEKNKVRRLENIPRVQDTSYGKTVVAFNLPFKNPTAEDVKEMFSKFGTIVTAKILTTRSPGYNIYHKRCRYFNQEVLSSKFGVVEFEKYADALDAIKDNESHLPKENRMKVVPLLPLKYRSEANNNRSTSTASFSSSRKNEERNYKPRSEVSRSRQVADSKVTENRPPISDKYYGGSYRPRYEWKPHSNIDVRGKLPNGRIHGKAFEGEKNYPVPRRQLGFSNALNVIPFHQQYRGPGRFYAFPRYQE